MSFEFLVLSFELRKRDKNSKLNGEMSKEANIR
jgi:hypothetical protein